VVEATNVILPTVQRIKAEYREVGVNVRPKAAMECVGIQASFLTTNSGKKYV
jgi:hypothetical protein